MNVPVKGQSYSSEYHKDSFLVRFSLLYFYVIYFILRSILILLVMPMTTAHCADSDIDKTISSPESCSARLFNWFQQNVMKANPDKCHLLLSTNQNKLTNINSNANYNSSSKKLLGITIETSLRLSWM